MVRLATYNLLHGVPVLGGTPAPDLDDAGRPTLWKVENSWGKDHGRDGFDTLSDAWFDEYVYQVVVDKRYLTPEERNTYETEDPKVLEPWDPMGSLARLA